VNELLEASARFPTVLFSVGLGIALIYWLFVLLGALDIDLFHAGDAAAAGKGAGDLLVGGSKGGAEALKGFGHGHGGHGHGHGGHLHAHGSHDADADGGGILDALGLTAVPITISLSVIMLLGWIGTLLGMHYGGGALSGLGRWLSPLVFLLVLVLALPVAGLLVRPLRSVFSLKESKRNRDYVGHTCTITTGQVDAEFGQATVEDHGTVLVIPVRCDRADVLSRGARALIIDFDDQREAYLVEPTGDLGGADAEPPAAS
jgi:hypothetical protein